MFEQIDLYCERLGPGFWAEPVNALANVSFFIAAWATWRLARQRNVLVPGVWLTVLLIVAIGIGSFLFHTLATGWAQLLDVGPILLFQLAFIFVYLRLIAGTGNAVAAGGVLAFLGIALYSRQFEGLLNGSMMYAPALGVLLMLGVYHALHARAARSLLLVGGVLFAIAVTFRSIDMAVCPAWPLGTHFLWHLTNGVVLYCAMKALIGNIAPASRPA
ncbi:MAG: ceramidase domain-containing protein [Gammaproteobacteria bacterium]|nr:ceramidase domain-containing protein [Gammaproteobacteria bacterium]